MVPHFWLVAFHRIRKLSCRICRRRSRGGLSEFSRFALVPLMSSGGSAIDQTVRTPDYGHEWAVIGQPGNRATLPNEVVRAGVFGNFPEYGSVGYVYRMRVTEVTAGEWFEFVQAYMPSYIQLSGNLQTEHRLTGSSIQTILGAAQINPNRLPDRACNMSWEYAAQYCNWLHNGKINELWAFETGLYEVSTFVTDEDRLSSHQLDRNPDALFWIPTFDEWVKAAYYDPDRYGEGRDGYWSYPNGSNRRSIGRLLPADGGERNASEYVEGGPFPLDAGSFPHVRSPWGLLDCEGGMDEMTSTAPAACSIADEPECRGSRRVQGTDWLGAEPPDPSGAEGNPVNHDRIEFTGTLSVQVTAGLRLASVVPCGADVAVPYGVVDLADIVGFVEAYLNQEPWADLREPLGSWDFLDVAAFPEVFHSRCGALSEP